MNQNNDLIPKRVEQPNRQQQLNQTSHIIYLLAHTSNECQMHWTSSFRKLPLLSTCLQCMIFRLRNHQLDLQQFHRMNGNEIQNSFAYFSFLNNLNLCQRFIEYAKCLNLKCISIQFFLGIEINSRITSFGDRHLYNICCCLFSKYIIHTYIQVLSTLKRTGKRKILRMKRRRRKSR